MKKKGLLMIVMCLTMALLGSGTMMAKKKVTKPRKPAKTQVVKPAATTYYANIDFRTVLNDNIGKKYNTQLMRNLMNCEEFVNRCGFNSFKPNVERLSGDVTTHNFDGRQVLMLRFADMYNPVEEQIVFFDVSNDTLVKTTFTNGSTWGELDCLEEGCTPFLTTEDANKIYWSTFTEE